MAAWRAIYTIWLRDMTRFRRDRARLIGMIGQPLLFLAVLGGGFAGTFRLPGLPAGFTYTEFIYPGMMAMSVLFMSIFSGLSVIADREFGFLKEVLVAPVPRWTIAVGKALGGSTVATLQAGVLLLVAPLLGLRPGFADVLAILGILLLMAFMVTSIGLALAARLASTEGFQMLVNMVIMPMFLLSGSVFPLGTVPAWLALPMRLNPLTYGVDALRHVVHRGVAGQAQLVQYSLAVDLAVLAIVGLLLTALSAVAFAKQE